MNSLLQIHSRKMNVRPDVNFEELARSTDDFNGAQLKAVCVEAGMLALRRDATEVSHSRNSFIFCQSWYILRSPMLLEARLWLSLKKSTEITTLSVA